MANLIQLGMTNNLCLRGGYNFIWRGPGDVGSEMGEWFNPKTGDQLHPNLNHLPPKKPHWGWRNKLKRILLDIFKN